MPLKELLDRFPNGASKELVALTFDDGFGSVLEHALPILTRHDLPFTIFLIGKMYERSGSSVDWVDRPPTHPLRTLDPSRSENCKRSACDSDLIATRTRI